MDICPSEDSLRFFVFCFLFLTREFVAAVGAQPHCGRAPSANRHGAATGSANPEKLVPLHANAPRLDRFQFNSLMSKGWRPKYGQPVSSKYRLTLPGFFCFG